MKPVKLLPADLDIIRCLHDDARASVASIADRLRMPESTVRHRLNRLVRERTIEFVAMTNPLQLGYDIWALFDVHVEMPKVRLVAQQLAERPEINFVGITTGAFDIFAAGVFRSNEHLLEFITNRLGQMPGIVRVSTSSVLQVVKRAMSFGVPDGAPAARPRARRRRASTSR